MNYPQGKAKGGLARAAALSPEERRRIASAAGKARWDAYRKRMSEQGYGASDNARVHELYKRLRAARHFPHNTCPASRHVEQMADCLLRTGRYDMFRTDPAHCAESMLGAVVALWEARSLLSDIAKRATGK